MPEKIVPMIVSCNVICWRNHKRILDYCIKDCMRYRGMEYKIDKNRVLKDIVIRCCTGNIRGIK